MTPSASRPDRFEQDPRAYASYLTTVDGRLRIDLAWANLCEHLPSVGADADRPRAVDVGGGPGDVAIRLARDGWHVTLVDGSEGMLELASAAARAAHVEPWIRCVQADVTSMPAELESGAFGVVVCHNVLEYVSHPDRALTFVAGLLRPGGIVSIMVRNRFGEAVKAAVAAGDLDRAERALSAESVIEPLYGEPARLFDRSSLAERLSRAGVSIVAERGVRVLSDYLPASAAATPAGYDRVLAFEHTLGATPELVDMARYIQVLAVPTAGR